ncbi:hypothetical protein AB0425_41295, partial [Actinosynnema sp. NPDC051121]
MSGLSRRAFLGAGLVTGIGLGVGIPFALGAGGFTSTGNLLRGRLRLPPAFTRPLPIPPVLSPVRSDADADYYEITQAPAVMSLAPTPRSNPTPWPPARCTSPPAVSATGWAGSS